eukprot:snap_masked-scaffold_19-processed-gene-2.15-mRNA-1 protein AED:1.00 eAED:1.00 QI:0/-1/0/0/-1/1/1/0/427
MDIQNRYVYSNKKWKEEKARREKERKENKGNPSTHIFKPKKVTNRFLPTPQSFYQRQKDIKEADKKAMTKFAQKKSARHNFRVRYRDLSLAKDDLVNELNLKITGELPTGQGRGLANPGKPLASRMNRVDSEDSEVQKVQNIYLNPDLEEAIEEDDDYLMNKSIIEDLFKHFAPQRIHEVEPLLKKHKNDVTVLFDKLARQFRINTESVGLTRNLRTRTTRQSPESIYSGSTSQMESTAKTSLEPQAYKKQPFQEISVDEADILDKEEAKAEKSKNKYIGKKIPETVKPVGLGSPDFGVRHQALSKPFRATKSGVNKFSKFKTPINRQTSGGSRNTRNSYATVGSLVSMQSFQSLPANGDSPEVEEFKKNLDTEIRGKLYTGEYVVSIVESGGRWWVNRDKPKQHPSQRKRNTLLEQLRRGEVPIAG